MGLVNLPAWIGIAGLGVGILYGMFGVGSAFATPVLAIIGVPGMAAVVGPLPALLPGSASGAWSYSRRGDVEWRVAKLTIAGAFPAAVLGALASQWFGGPALVIASGVVLLVVGIRVLRTDTVAASARLASLPAAPIVAAATVVGFFSGLLANGGGFLLVPMFLMVLGLEMRQATGTSLVVATTLTIPTLATHAFLGDIDWAVSMMFALGMIPGAFVGAALSHRLPAHQLKRAFGFLLVGFAGWFLIRQGMSFIRG